MPLEQAYPGVQFRPHTRSWWARVKGLLPECSHLEHDPSWAATYAPDTLYLRGKARAVRQPERPLASLCLRCTMESLRKDLGGFAGRMVAFQPDPAQVSQIFYLAEADFDAAGLKPEVSEALNARLSGIGGPCSARGCGNHAKWLWIPQEEVPGLDDVALIHAAAGRALCAGHGVAQFCLALGAMEEANLEYLNAPYGEAGAYVWI